ncbi:MAG TPA: hypothetical protein PLM75_07495 [bacterium]|nr:hypothetical protein [bacterium]HPP87682.1 hypothetical protein [bacterium]
MTKINNKKCYITYCCKDKKTDSGLLAAIDRYLSDRIKYVYNLAKQDNAEFFILSGKFGLISAYEKIEYYDKLLGLDEIQKISEKIAEQLKLAEAQNVIFFHFDIKKDPNIQRYYDALKLACQKAEINFISKEIDIE